jgi:ethanolaminephosphotransferase
MIWFMICIPFFFNTWEEFYTGELNFPIIHGVSEGTLIACFSINLSGYFGKQIWLTKLSIGVLKLQFNHLMVLLCFFSGLGFGLYSVFNVIRNYNEKRKEAVGNMAIFLFMIGNMLIVINFSFNDSLIIQKYPKLILVLYGFAFAKLIGHLQLAHICDSPFMQYRKSLLISIFCIASVSLIKHYGNHEIVNIDYLIISFLIMHFVVWMHFAYYLSEELCHILGIYRFSTKKRAKKEE